MEYKKFLMILPPEMREYLEWKSTSDRRSIADIVRTCIKSSEDYQKFDVLLSKILNCSNMEIKPPKLATQEMVKIQKSSLIDFFDQESYIIDLANETNAEVIRVEDLKNFLDIKE